MVSVVNCLKNTEVNYAGNRFGSCVFSRKHLTCLDVTVF